MSQAAEASRLPSGLYFTDTTNLVCPFKTASSLPDATSHRRTVLSAEAEASRLPSGLNAADQTRSSCPLRESKGRGASAPDTARAVRQRAARVSAWLDVRKPFMSAPIWFGTTPGWRSAASSGMPSQPHADSENTA